MSKEKKKMEIYGSDIPGEVLHERGSLNGWKLPNLFAFGWWGRMLSQRQVGGGHHGELELTCLHLGGGDKCCRSGKWAVAITENSN
jgi:hypothetical protein